MSWNIAKPGDQINGPVSVTGNLNVDSNTLFVDSANNRVGVLTASPTVPLDVVGDAKVSGNLTVDTNTLVVDAANNRLGIGTATPLSQVHSATNIAAANHDWTSQFVAPTVGLLAASNDSSAWIRIATYNSNPTHDPYLNFLTAGGQNWSIGIDNSDSDKLKVAMASSFNGTNEFLTIASDGVCTWSNVGGVAGTAMTLNATGLGVGGSPSAKLHVNADNASTISSILAKMGGGDQEFKLVARNGDGGAVGNVESVRFGLERVGVWNSGIRFFRGGAGTDGYLLFSTSGQDRLTLDALGRLSVGGSTTGTAKFEIQGTTVGERILFSQTASNTAARTMFSIGYRTGGTSSTGYNPIVCATETQYDDSFGLKIFSGSSSSIGIHVNYAGRIGIGMADSMLNRMQVQGAGQATTTVSDNGDGSALFLSDTGSAANNGGLLFLGSASANGQRPHVGIKSLLTDATANGTGDMAFLTRTTTGATTLTEKMRLLTNGNLVLGRTSPLFGSVSGRTTFTIDGSAGSIISWGYNGTVSTYIVADAAGTELGEARNQPVRFITNSTERLRIKSTGQLNFNGLASDPAGAAAGDVYYNTTTNKLKCYNGTTWNDLF